MCTIDLSKIKSGEEFARMLVKSKGNCFMLVGEEQNSVLSKINEPETTPMFKIGDKVRMNREMLAFNGVRDSDTWTVVGMEQVDDQYLYVVRNDYNRYEFFGYELEKA